MARLVDQVADILAEARALRVELARQAVACQYRRRKGGRPGRGVPILYFYPSIFNGTIYTLDNLFPRFRDTGTWRRA